MATVLHTNKIISPLENREQLIRFRVYGKSATSTQTDKDGQRRTDRYTLVEIHVLANYYQ